MLAHDEGRLRFLRRRTGAERRRLRHGVYLLPSLFTMGNMFCGYACVVYAMRGEYETAAPFIGFAFVLDMLDGRIARLTGGESEFGLQFDSLADVISFGIAPAILSFAWGLAPLGRLGWAAGVPVPRLRGDAAGAVQHSGHGGRRQTLLRRDAEPGGRGGAGGDGLRVFRTGCTTIAPPFPRSWWC